MYRNARVVGWVALVLGVFTATTPAWAETTPASAGATVGLGALTALYALWSLIARDPTKDHWALSVVGLVMFMSPWIGMFADRPRRGSRGSSARSWWSSVACPTCATRRATSPRRPGSSNWPPTRRSTGLRRNASGPLGREHDVESDPRPASPRSRPSGVGVPAGCSSKSLMSESFTPKTLSRVEQSSPRDEDVGDQRAQPGGRDHEVQVRGPHRRAAGRRRASPTGPSCGIGYGVGVTAQKR